MEILARAVGRRKEAVAQIQLIRGTGQFFINDKPAQSYLQNNMCSLISIKAPFEAAVTLYSNSNGNKLELEDQSNYKQSLYNELGSSVLVEKLDVITEPGTINVNSSISVADKSITNTNVEPGTEISDPAFISIDQIDIIIKVKGGGLIGQAEAIKLGVARAFCLIEKSNPSLLIRKLLKTKGYLTQDSRVKERQKYGLKKARKASQYHKR